MKKFIITIIAIVMAFATFTAQAMTKAEVESYILDTVPGAGPKEIDACYAAMQHDGFYKIHSSKVRIVCSKNELTRVWE